VSAPLRALANRLSPTVLAGLVLAAALSCRGGCGSTLAPGRPLGGRLALFPAEARVVVAFDFARLRGSPLSTLLAQLATGAPADQAQIDAFSKRTGLDPWRDIESLVVAFPDDARRGGQFGLVLRAAHLDAKRLIAYARDDAQNQGGDLVSAARGPWQLWSRKGEADLAGFFIDERTFALGAGGWAERMADLAAGATSAGSADSNADLVHLCERVAGTRAIWAAALVPAETRKALAADPRFGSAASVSHLAVGVDLEKGFNALVQADLASAADAQGLATQVTQTLRDASKNAEVLMLGLGPYLDGVSTKANGTSFEVRASLSEAQASDLLARAAAFLKLMRQGTIPGFRRP